MTHEYKELLLKDLCARLPYNVRVEYNGTTLTNIFDVLGIAHGRIMLCLPFMSKTECPLIEEVKPYLFPLSSMTTEQSDEFFTYFHDVEKKEIETSGDYLKAAYLGENSKRDWLNKNHLDYNYLIPKGLAIDATGLNIY